MTRGPHPAASIEAQMADIRVGRPFRRGESITRTRCLGGGEKEISGTPAVVFRIGCAVIKTLIKDWGRCRTPTPVISNPSTLKEQIRCFMVSRTTTVTHLPVGVYPAETEVTEGEFTLLTVARTISDGSWLREVSKAAQTSP